MKNILKHLKKDWYKYFFDMLVVIVGITIAFNVNSWNEAKKMITVERQYYSDIIQELNEDLIGIKENRAFNNYFLPQYKRAKEIILTDTDRLKIDSLGHISLQLMFSSDFKKEVSIYDALSSSSNLDLITNKNILKKLQNLGSLYKEINTLESNQHDVIVQISEKVLEYVRMDPFKVMEPEKLYHFRFQNIFEIYLFMGGQKEVLYAKSENDINELLVSINEELN